MADPLRPDLYNRLNGRSGAYGFGKVLLVHEGEAMLYRVEPDAARGGQPTLVVESYGEVYRVNCPLCSDTRHRLWINHMWGKYNESTRSRNLWLAHCYNDNCLSDYANQRKLYDMVYSDVRNNHSFPDPVKRGARPSRTFQGYRPPADHVVPLNKLEFNHPAVVYMRSRNYDIDWLGRKMGVGYCETAYPEFPWANNRIIIPIVFRGQNVGWQARAIGPVAKGVPKYFTMPGMKKSECLYNFDSAKSFPFVVLTEGPTKVWSVGPETVAQLGDKTSSVQTMLLGQNWETVVIYLDGNAHERAEETYCALRGGTKRVLVRLPEDKEPGDFTRDYNRALIYHEAQRQGVTLPKSLLEPS